MTFPTASGSTALAPSNTGSKVTANGSLAQSREEVALNTVKDEKTVLIKQTPEVKPWAHLVAGGLVLFATWSSLQNPKEILLMVIVLEE